MVLADDSRLLWRLHFGRRSCRFAARALWAQLEAALLREMADLTLAEWARQQSTCCRVTGDVQVGWAAAAPVRAPAGGAGREAGADARADVIVGPSLARSARWVECEGEAYPQRCEATILNSSSSLTNLNEKTAAAQRLMCGHLQMVDVIKHGITTGRYKLHLLCLPVELSSNHLKVAQCETS